jgi:hypothetical protein
MTGMVIKSDRHPGRAAARSAAAQVRDLSHEVLAIWILAPLALLKLVQGANVAGLNPLVASRGILETADRVPVDSFPPDAAAHLVFLFSVWGLLIFTLGLVALIALIRYRAMIPFVYLLLLIEQFGRKTLSMIHLDRPFASAELTAGNIINWVFLAAIVAGFLLSLARRKPA